MSDDEDFASGLATPEPRPPSPLLVQILEAQPDGFVRNPRALNYSAMLAASKLPEPEFRTELAKMLRAKAIIPTAARRIYQLPDRCCIFGAGGMLLECRGAQLAGLIGAEMGRKIAVSVALAERITLGVGRLEEAERDGVDCALEGITEPWRCGGLLFEPAPAVVWQMSSEVSRVLIQGVRRQINGRGEAGLQALGRAFGQRHLAPAAAHLQADLHLMPEPYRIAAEAAIATLTETGLRLSARRAPADFVPPPVDEKMPSCEGWHIMLCNEGGVQVEKMCAPWMWGHPRLGSGRLSQTTELVWIDVKLGYVRTLSRLYRIFGEGTWYREAGPAVLRMAPERPPVKMPPPDNDKFEDGCLISELAPWSTHLGRLGVAKISRVVRQDVEAVAARTLGKSKGPLELVVEPIGDIEVPLGWISDVADLIGEILGRHRTGGLRILTAEMLQRECEPERPDFVELWAWLDNNF